jgi:prepilin-type N-terminal cleavage/methylation domain-containing protein
VVNNKKTISLSERHGFTLLEILVSISILSLMLVVLAQLAEISSKSMNDGVRRADNFTKARSALDLFASDIANGIFRSDLGAFRDDKGLYSEGFFTRRPGIGGDRPLSLIAYRNNQMSSVLERASKTILWSDPFIGFGDATKISRFSSLAPTDYQEIATGILQLQFYFIDASGNYGREYANGYNTSSAGTSFTAATFSRAVGIALVSVDETTYQLLKTTGDIQALAGEFKPQITQNQSYQQHWNEVLLLPSVVNSYPASIRKNVRIFERVIPLPEI